jgi:3-hydroxyisobutyrate dehydrogenase-like beta-hydroxyacid dehydrogenase
LVKVGFSIVIFVTDEVILARAKDNGVDTKGYVLEVAAVVKIVILWLASPAALNSATSELADSVRKDTIIIETDTLTIEDKEAARDRAAPTEITRLDCTLSGTGHQARTGDLVIFTSGDEKVVKNVCLDFLILPRLKILR